MNSRPKLSHFKACHCIQYQNFVLLLLFFFACQQKNHNCLLINKLLLPTDQIGRIYDLLLSYQKDPEVNSCINEVQPAKQARAFKKKVIRVIKTEKSMYYSF